MKTARLLAPILPSKVVAVGRNYADHVAEVFKKGKTFLPDHSTAATNRGEEWEPRDMPLAKS